MMSRRQSTLLRRVPTASTVASVVVGPVAAVLAIVLSSCTSLLTGPDLQHNPDNPTKATSQALFTGAQTSLAVQQEGQLARTVCVWMQQCAGQLQAFALLDVYVAAPDDYYPIWSATFGGGGLIDLRTLRQQALAAGDSTYAGIAQVLEAWQVGTAADVWGDVPYREAAQRDQVPVPRVDAQASIYADVQLRLDTAIRQLRATGPSNVGPQGADLVYGGVPARWRRLAYTLKARYYLHTAGRVGAAAYRAALAAADSGIAQNEDYSYAFSGAGPTSSNDWSTFQSIYPGQLVAGAFLVGALRSSADPRLAQYFAPNAYGDFVGAQPGRPGSPDSLSTLSQKRLDPKFGQPLATWAETQLIAAEAAYRSDPSDASQSARSALRRVWTKVGVTSAIPRPGTPGPTDPLLVAILTEKYVTNFQNVEVWNDWKRTCIPTLQPAPGGTIPRRLAYPLSERNTNPNLPPDGRRNWNDTGGPCGGG